MKTWAFSGGMSTLKHKCIAYDAVLKLNVVQLTNICDSAHKIDGEFAISQKTSSRVIRNAWYKGFKPLFPKKGRRTEVEAEQLVQDPNLKASPGWRTCVMIHNN